MGAHRLAHLLLSIIFIVASINSTNCALLHSLLTEVPNDVQVSNQVEIENFQVFAKIKYRYARTMVFCQMFNPNPTEQEAVFEMDLPREAFISNFTMEINGIKKYNSYINGRTEANEQYSNARGTGISAAIINQEEQFFNISVNLAANSSVLFFLEYEEEIPKLHVGKECHYQYALSLIPEMLKVKHFCVDIDILEFKPLGITSVNLRNKYGNSTVQVNLKKDAIILATERENRTRIIWEPSPTGKLKQMSEDGIVGKFQLNYHFNDSSESINDIVIRNGYFVHRFDSRNSPVLPLFAIFVLDISGSMTGLRGNRTKLAMEKVLLNQLNPTQDFFHVITFSSSVQHFEPRSNALKRFYPATDILKNEAKEYINKQIFDGSTNIHEALIEALETAGNSSSLFNQFCQQLVNWGVKSSRCENTTLPTPMIFFLTDGYPTTGIIDRQTILQHIQTKNSNRVPIFSIGLGTEADHSLLEALSIMNHGIARKIYNDADVILQLEDFYKTVASPVLKDVKFWYTSRTSTVNSLSPKSLEISYDADRQPWLSSQDEILVIGRLHKQPVQMTKQYPLMNGTSEHEHGLPTHHGLQYQGHTIYEIGKEYGEFQARICPCGICPSLGVVNNGTDFLSSFRQEGIQIFCPKDDEDDSFMERFWVHKTLRKLIKEVVASGSEATKKEIIRLSKQHNLVTPFTSLVIITPFDKKGSNRKEHDPPPVPDIMRSQNSFSDDNIIDKSFFPDRDKYPRGVDYYSGSMKSRKIVATQTKYRPSLVSYLRSLRDEQENLTQHRNGSSKSLIKPLSILDMKWIDGQNFSLNLKNKKTNEISVYHILRNLTEKAIMGSKFNPCISPASKRQGRCLHFATCLEPVYARNITLFVKGYFCPIITESNIKYLGTCCTN